MSNFIDNLAPIFSASNSYTAGDKFLYQDMLYKVVSDFSGSFDATKVEPLYLTDIITGTGGGETVIIPNENLLDNPFFTVNSRGQTSYTSSGYTVDRWRMASNLNLNVLSEGIKLEPSESATSRRMIIQFIGEDLHNELVGKIVTLSLLTSNGIITVTDEIKSSGDSPNITSDNISLFYRSSDKAVEIGVLNGTSATIKAIKLELGSVSTLAYDTAPDLAIETFKCRTSTADSTDIYANKTVSYK